MKQRYQKESLLTVIGVAALTMAFFWGFLIPERKATAAARQEISDLKREINQVPLQVAKLHMLHQKIEKRQKYLQKSANWLPGNPDVSGVLRNITNLAQQEKLTVIKLEPLQPVPHESYRSLPFHISFHGNFNGIASFLKGLENHTRTVTFEKLTITRDNRENGSSAKAELDFSVYSAMKDSSNSTENNSSRNE
jgi:Tfp pilus assembly protein PilO